MVRIISGKHRGRKLAVQAKPSSEFRPTMSVTREAVFNILSHGDLGPDGRHILQDARVLDLFCGTGAYGFEALSRGAASVVFIDMNQEHVNAVRSNASALGESLHVTAIRSDSSNPPMSTTHPCNLIFVDPPYRSELLTKTLANLIRGNWLAPGAVIIAECSSKDLFKAPEAFTLLTERKYGKAKIAVLEFS